MERPDLSMVLDPHFLDPSEADHAFTKLRHAIPWRQDAITLFGKTHPLPRLHQWFADEGLAYRWSGLTMTPQGWLPDLVALKDRVETATRQRFNSVLANLYRNGSDTMGWHADDEAELGENPVIASVSLGATRDFRLRHSQDKEVPPLTVPLTHGSLLVMDQATQHAWQHSLPRRARCQAERINLTFRRVV